MVARSTSRKTPRSFRFAFPAIAVCALVALPGCGDAWLRATASLGGSRAGSRGNVHVVFINNTPHRAVFTFGSYDAADQSSQPSFGQFVAGASGRALEADEVSSIMDVRCARTFAIGSPRLLKLIRDNLATAAPDEDALIEGVAFYTVGDDDDLQETGKAPPFEALLGVDFPCNALLILRLEINDAGEEPYRVDFEVIPSASTR